MLHSVVLAGVFGGAVLAQPGAEVGEDPEPEESFRWPRAARDLGAAMALGVAWYVSQIEINKRDFDFDRTWSDQIRRLTTGDGYRFDDNGRVLNVGHSFVGGYYHLVARVNGGSMVQAMLFDLAASTAWELTVEHREVFSLNDTVTTSIGGVALGESLFRMGDFFARSRPTALNRLFMGAFSPARALTWMYGDVPEPSRAGFDDHGLAADGHHRFALSLGAVTSVKSTGRAGEGWHVSALADLELIDLPGYEREGTRDRSLAGGEMTRLAAEYAGSGGDMQTLTLLARSSLWGRYRQETVSPAAGELGGHATFVGLSTAFDVSLHDVGDSTDFLMAVHLVGPSADVALYRSPWRLRLAADLYPDFAMVRPFALADVAMREADVPGQSTLAHDYYYALGITAALRAEASYRRARAGAAIEWNGFDAIEGLDRHQDAYTSPTGRYHPAISDDAAMTDQRLELRLHGLSPLPFTGVQAGVNLDYVRRTGAATDAKREHTELCLTFHATYTM